MYVWAAVRPSCWPPPPSVVVVRRPSCLFDAADISGATNALFPTVFGDYFNGRRFIEAAVELYAAIDVMPIGICRRSATTNEIEILLGPADHLIRDGELVYVLSQSLERAKMVASYPVSVGQPKAAVADKLTRCTEVSRSLQMNQQVGVCSHAFVFTDLSGMSNAAARLIGATALVLAFANRCRCPWFQRFCVAQVLRAHFRTVSRGSPNSGFAPRFRKVSLGFHPAFRIPFLAQQLNCSA